METFLDLTAKRILHEYSPEALDQLCVVFPSRRAGVFFRKSLWQQSQSSSFLPDIFSMEDFVFKNTGFLSLDNISLTFELFEVHKQLQSESASFDDFLKYANTILKDFNELDMHLSDIHKAFSYLEDYRELKLWGLEKDELSEFQKKYLGFFKSLSDYYDLLTHRLLKRNIAYQGLAFRQLAENIANYPGAMKWEKVFFAGFNVLTPSEERIVKHYLQNSKGEIIWNADKYYIENQKQEAGIHLRRLFKQPSFSNDYIADNFSEKPKSIDVHGCPGDIAQVKLVGELLKNSSEENDIAIVLADETLLEPLLNSIPGNISAFNVTMGLPLGNTPVFSVFENFFRLHIAPYKRSKSKKSDEGKVYYYHKDILRVLAHPLIKEYIAWVFKDIDFSNDFLINRIHDYNKAYYSLEDLEGFFKSMGLTHFERIRFLWDDWQNSANLALDNLLKLLNELQEMTRERASNIDNPLLSEYIYRFSSVFQAMKNLHASYGSLKNPGVLWRFLTQLINYETISFRGEPLKGIQVMGMLETRLLDFERVILLSANEEFLPGGQFDQTLMPYEMRLNYKLPMKKDKAAIFAHHFYSLLQRAGKVDVLYNSIIEGNKGSEMSRFVKQVLYELPKYNSSHLVRHKNMAIKPDLQKQKQTITIEKSNALMQRLREKAESGFAATTLFKYRLCPLKYYLEEIANLEEREEVEETIEARTLGNVIHETLEQLYQKLPGKLITEDEIETLRKQASGALKSIFKNNYGEEQLYTGKNLLIYNVAAFWIDEYLKKEKDDAAYYQKNQMEYYFYGTEKYLETFITINQPQEEFRVKLKGKIDRMDSVGDETRIIDYKTGKVNQADVTFKHVDQLMESTAKKEAFQLMIYQLLFKDNFPEKENNVSAIFSFPVFKNGYMYIKEGKETGIYLESLDIFREKIAEILQEIFNEKIPFRQTEELQNCRNCTFRDLCNRNI